MLHLFIRIIWNRIFFFLRRPHRDLSPFPKKIDSFVYIEETQLQKNHRSFKYALYKNKTKQAFVKMWTGHVKNYDYYSLLNELKSYTIFNKYENFDNINNIHIPKLLFSEITDNKIILGLEYVNAPDIQNLNDENKILIYKQIQEYFIGSYAKLTKTSGLLKQYLIELTIIFPVILLVSIITNKIKLRHLLSITKLYLDNFSILILSRKLTICHRSLEDHNIMIKDKTIYLIDLQLLTVCHPYFEYSQTLLFNWHDKPLAQKYLDSIKPEVDNPKLLRFICMYTAAYHIFVGYESNSDFHNYLRYFLYNYEN